MLSAVLNILGTLGDGLESIVNFITAPLDLITGSINPEKGTGSASGSSTSS